MVRFMIMFAIWTLIGTGILVCDFIKITHWIRKKSNGNDKIYDNIESVFTDYIFDANLLDINAGIFTIVMIFCWPYTVFRMETGIRKAWKNYISNRES